MTQEQQTAYSEFDSPEEEAAYWKRQEEAQESSAWTDSDSSEGYHPFYHDWRVINGWKR